MRFPDIPRLRPARRLLRIPLLLVVVSLALRAVLTALSARHGFGSPAGMNAGYLLVACTATILRLTLLIAVPGVLTYLVIARMLNRVLRRADHAVRQSDSPEVPSPAE